MAQKVITIYTDDLTGKESSEVQPHTFSLDGVGYEIDLDPDSYDKLYEALAPFIRNGRKTGRTGGVKAARKGKSQAPQSEEIRKWARENGFTVNDRGRIPANVREAYDMAH